MKRRNYTPLYCLLAVFIVPIALAICLYAYQYTGITTNKGTWINPPIALSEILTHPKESATYQWHIVFKPSKERTRNINSIIKILGTKSILVEPYPVSSLVLTEKGSSLIDEHQIYLADPQNKMILLYSEDQIMDLASDLKRLLKPIEKHQ